MAARQMREKALRGEAETLREQVGQLRAQMIETAARLQAQEDKVSALETALAESQQSFGDAAGFKDPSRAQRMQAEHDKLAKKLKQLEAEYFEREN